jgi:hypothetical protein
MTINHTIIPKKQLAWHWRMHPYFTKQPSNVVKEYIDHFTKEGKVERQKSKLLQEFSNYESIPYEQRDIRAYDKNKIDQIDVLWLDDHKDIVFAFEIETSTMIKSGLERFYSLLNARFSAVLAKQRMYIIIPNETSRIHTLKKELWEGTFAGQPFYMDKKVKYLFLEDLKRDINSERIQKIEDLDSRSQTIVE